ncbi:MAG TPA: NADH-quinone oxidoreductase subunit C [Methylomirabilota bacterium]|nr:NADH-quinone oxidoreductase subunit C [Methylomirabilota bacterium]
MTASQAAAGIRETFGVDPAVDGSVLSVTLPVARWTEFGRFAQHELGCRYFNWLSAVDWKAEGFEVVCRLENLDAGMAVMMRARLGAGATNCPTLTGLFPGADWMERECYDMFGVVFDDHPDLRRILLPEDWDGHPLRKDYALDTAHHPYR